VRSFDAEDKWDVKELGRINAQAWQTELLKLNPDYVCWGPGEDCMWVKGDGWTSPITAESWSEFENKGLDDLNEVVNFYMRKERIRAGGKTSHRRLLRLVWDRSQVDRQAHDGRGRGSGRARSVG